MSTGKSVSVWYTEDERVRVEQAAALAGYTHVSTYIRDTSLGRSGQRDGGRDSLEAWAERQELSGRLAEIERTQKTSQALLTMLLFLARKKATTGEFNDLVVACRNAGVPGDVLAATFPDLATLVSRFAEDS